jgi:hypothetical protein
MTDCTCRRQPLYEPDVPVTITPNDCPIHGLHRRTRKLGPAQESWLRRHIPVFGTMRDHAVAAGLVEPEAPALSEAQAERIARIRGRVLASLNGVANQNDEEA